MNGVSSEGERDGNCLLLSGLVFLVLDFLGCEFLAESRLISVDAVILFFQQSVNTQISFVTCPFSADSSPLGVKARP